MNTSSLELEDCSGSIGDSFAGYSGPTGPGLFNGLYTAFDDPEAINSAPSNWHVNTNDQLQQSTNIHGPHFTTTDFDEPGTYLRSNGGLTRGDLNATLSYFNLASLGVGSTRERGPRIHASGLPVRYPRRGVGPLIRRFRWLQTAPSGCGDCQGQYGLV